MQQVLKLRNLEKKLRGLHVKIVALTIVIRVVIKQVLLKSLETNHNVQLFKTWSSK